MATLLKNCRIYDGTGSDAVNGSVLFEGDRIIEVGDVDERVTGLQRLTFPSHRNRIAM